MKVIYRILLTIFLLIYGILLLSLFWLLLPLQALSKKDLLLYKVSNNVITWFNNKIYPKTSDIDVLKKETIKKLSEWGDKLTNNG